jgi:hypothetical protein
MIRSNKYKPVWNKGFCALPLSVVIVFTILTARSSVGACPYDADIILDGSDYSDISGIRNSEPEGWVIDSDVIYTFWENEWVEYTAYLTEGIWEIGICAINYSHPGHDGLGSDPSWYPQFELSNSLTDDILIVPASDTILNTGSFCYEIPSDGFYIIRFTWQNDKAWGERPDGLPILDANIQIVRVFFEEGTCSIEAIEASIDIKPQSCPNVLNVKSRGILPVAILGSDEFDVSNIDSETISLEGVPPLRSSIEDVATPIVDGVDCDCTTDGPDGFTDLTLKFDTQEIVAALGDIEGGQERILYLTGQLNDGTPFEGSDCIRLVPYKDQNGDQMWVELEFLPHAEMKTDTDDNIAFFSGFAIQLWDDNFYAYNQGARSAIITGPGLPITGQILKHYYPEPTFRLYPTGEWGLWLDDTTISTIPDNSTYTIGIYEETADTVSLSDTPLQSYTKTFTKGPMLNLELNVSLFPALITPSSHDESVLNIPGLVEVSWTNPSNMAVDWTALGLHSPDWSAEYMTSTDVTPGDESATLDTTSLPSDVLANQLYMYGTDAYGRRFGFAWALF